MGRELFGNELLLASVYISYFFHFNSETLLLQLKIDKL